MAAKSLHSFRKSKSGVRYSSFIKLENRLEVGDAIQQMIKYPRQDSPGGHLYTILYSTPGYYNGYLTSNSFRLWTYGRRRGTGVLYPVIRGTLDPQMPDGIGTLKTRMNWIGCFILLLMGGCILFALMPADVRALPDFMQLPLRRVLIASVYFTSLSAILAAIYNYQKKNAISAFRATLELMTSKDEQQH
jgi:hypothetical protein